jgi:hypothetical protein
MPLLRRKYHPNIETVKYMKPAVTHFNLSQQAKQLNIFNLDIPNYDKGQSQT